MANLRDIRKRIEASLNIKKITTTMEKIASVRMIQANKRLISSKEYCNAISQYSGDLFHTALREEKYLSDISMLDSKKEINNICLIVIAANQGMCGGFNTTINKLADEVYKKHKNAQKSVCIYSIGRKAYQYFKNNNIPVIKADFSYSDTITMKDVVPFSKQLIDDFCSDKIDEIYLIYTKYLSNICRDPVVEALLPCRKYLDCIDAQDTKLSLCSPNNLDLLELLIPELISNRIFQGILESSVSEHIARRMAMQQASTSAKDMIDELRSVYNTVRKNKITRELNEIMGTVIALGRH